jgi:hypothetical protein
MNEPKKKHELYQVYATEVKSGQLVAVPMFGKSHKKACDLWANTMTDMIAKGFEKRYRDPQVAMYLGSNESSIILEK